MASWALVARVLVETAFNAATPLVDPAVATCAFDRAFAYAFQTHTAGLLTTFAQQIHLGAGHHNLSLSHIDPQTFFLDSLLPDLQLL